MTALASIKAMSNISSSLAGVQALSDSATVGYNKTFVPDGPIALGVQQYSERSGSYPVGFPRYTFSLSRPKAGSRVYRIKEKVTVPVMNVTSPSTGSGIQPIPSVAYTMIMNREFVIPEPATAAERLLFWSFVQSLNATNLTASDGAPQDYNGSIVLDAVLSSEAPY